MLPRVSAALTKFVAPIASSRKQEKINRDGADSERAFRRFTPDRRRNDEEQDSDPPESPEPQTKDSPRLRLVEPGEASTRTAPLKNPMGDRPGLSVAQSFLDLINRFAERRGSLFRWFGQQSYQAAERKQKKSARFRKGVMLDEKVE